jgi:uncharacterized protein
MIARRTLLLSPIVLAVATSRGYTQTVEQCTVTLIDAARAQIGVTTSYDPAYYKIAFPGGDVPREVGVCTDVVIRAFRDALSVDLQAIVNADMKANFSAYPTNWGLKRTDANIDHRRVPNLQVFLRRKGAELRISKVADDYQPGDIVTQMLPGNLPHIVIVSDKTAPETNEPMVIHNIGQGTREEATLFTYKVTGHYRWKIPVGICSGMSPKF